MPPPSKKIKGSPSSSSSNSQKEERENEGNRNNEGKEGKKRVSETSLIYDGLYYTYAHGFVSLQSCKNFAF